jgi:hypothetical protein
MRSSTSAIPAPCLAAPRSADSLARRAGVSPSRAEDAGFRPGAERASSLPTPKRPPPGRSLANRHPARGVVQASRDLHADVTALLLVTSSPAWARAADGAVTLDGKP